MHRYDIIVKIYCFIKDFTYIYRVTKCQKIMIKKEKRIGGFPPILFG